MYLSYKLKDGYHVRVFNYDLLETDRKKMDKYYMTGVEGLITDADGKHVGIEIYAKILKDIENDKYYFVVRGQKIYVTDYEYLEVLDVVNKIKGGEELSFDMFISSLMKNPQNFVFKENRLDFGIEKNYKEVFCVPNEGHLKKNRWPFVLETVPLNEEEKKIYGIVQYESKTFYNKVRNGYIDVMSMDYINNHEYGNKNVIIRKKRKRR